MYRNKLNISLRLAKQNYLSTQLGKDKFNMRNTWKVLNSIIMCNKKSTTNRFVVNDQILTDNIEIGNEFNKYFANIGPVIANSIMHAGSDFSFYLKDAHYSATCFFRPTDEDEIHKILGKMGNKKCPVKSDLVKKTANEISYPLIHV